MKWFKHNQQPYIPTGVNPKDRCQVEFCNKRKFIGAAGSITWSAVLKYRVINKFIRKDAYGWMTHDGKENPIPNTQVEYCLRDGAIFFWANSDDLIWNWGQDINSCNNIIKYRPIVVEYEIEKPMNKDNKIVSATWIKHNGGSNPVPNTQVEYMLNDDGCVFKGNSDDLVWEYGCWEDLGNGIIKYRVVKEFVKSSDLIASIDTPRMKDNRIERVLASVYVTFGEIETIVTLRMIKPELSLMTAKVTVEKYFPTKEYGRYLLNKILGERSIETIKPKPVDL